MIAVRLLPKGCATQVENQGNYRLGNSVDQSNVQEPSLSESACEHEKNFELFVDSLLDNNKSSEESGVFGSPEGINLKDSDQPLEQNSIHNLPHSSTDKGKSSSPE